MPKLPARCGAVLLLALACLSQPGCERGWEATYPVKGRVMYGSRPLADVKVEFFAQSGPAKEREIWPSARTDKDGYFQVTTYEESDGAPAGEYKVTLFLERPLPRQYQNVDEEMRPSAGNALPQKYGFVDSTPFVVTIEPGPNELEPFQVQ